MPMTPAERQRQYRERLKQNNPEKYEEIRKKNLQRIKNKYVKISELSESKKIKRRRDWRRIKMNLKKKLDGYEKKKSSRKKYFRRYHKLKQTIVKQKKKIEIQKKKIAALKKRLYRQKMLFEFQKPDNNETIDDNETVNELTPNSKCNSFVQELSSISIQDKEKVKRVLLQHNVLTTSLSKHYADSKSNTERNIIKRLCTSILARRYKVRTRLGGFTGLKGRIRFFQKNQLSKRSKTAEEIRFFFNQDDVSRPSAGKKETKTQRGKKKQKRYLLDTLKSLHQKFKHDTGSAISYTTFIKNKPFYVVKPRLADRDTCICKIHANMELKFIALKKLNILNTCSKLKDLVKFTVCDEGSKECMYSECEICKEMSLKYNFTETNQEKCVSWLEWSSENVQYKKNGEIKNSKRFLPVLKEDKLKNLISVTDVQFNKFKEHIFNIRHQYKTYKCVKDNLADDEIVIHCDFSENYTCKMHEEIQAVHFGASKYQISLHTSVVYKKDEKPRSYCTFSDSTKHSPESIWAHLKPVLVDLKQMYPQVTILHVFSDGPVTQYKQKKNFFLFKIYIGKLGFNQGTWNFSESYHGKGAADGVGANIKRLLDEKVSHGKDVLNAESAFNLLKNSTKTKLFYVNEDEINEIETNNQIAFNSLSAVPGTLKIHQIHVVDDDTHDIFYRCLSCFCNSSMMRGFCTCFSLKKHCLIKRLSKKRPRLSSSDTDEEIYNTNAQWSPKTAHVMSATVEHNSALTSIEETKQTMLNTDENTFNVNRNSQKLFTLSVDGPGMTADKELSCCSTSSKTLKNPVTILSDVKVSWSRDKLQNMLKESSRYNMSSVAIQRDFPEMIVIDKIVHKKTLSQKRNIIFFDTSNSDIEN